MGYVKREQVTDSWDERRIVHYAPELGSSPNSYLDRQTAVRFLEVDTDLMSLE